MDEQDVRISFDDRGFLFADGVYEVVHLYGGRFFEWQRHMVRLARSLKGVALESGVDFEELTRSADILRQEFGESDGALYIEVTRGAYPRSHAFPPQGTAPSILMWLRPAARTDENVVSRGISVITVPDVRWAKVWIKTIGLLPNVMAKQEALNRGAFDAVFVRDGMVTEATSANVFAVQNNTLMTAPVTNYILPGITREVLLELADSLDIPVRLEPFTPEEMNGADEVFLSGTTTEVLPVTKIDGKVLSAQWGPVTEKLYRALRERTASVS